MLFAELAKPAPFLKLTSPLAFGKEESGTSESRVLSPSPGMERGSGPRDGDAQKSPQPGACRERTRVWVSFG